MEETIMHQLDEYMMDLEFSAVFIHFTIQFFSLPSILDLSTQGTIDDLVELVRHVEMVSISQEGRVLLSDTAIDHQIVDKDR
jgi:hypothetical protein